VLPEPHRGHCRGGGRGRSGCLLPDDAALTTASATAVVGTPPTPLLTTPCPCPCGKSRHGEGRIARRSLRQSVHLCVVARSNCNVPEHICIYREKGRRRPSLDQVREGRRCGRGRIGGQKGGRGRHGCPGGAATATAACCCCWQRRGRTGRACCCCRSATVTPCACRCRTGDPPPTTLSRHKQLTS
jgi:hypothetical protein